MISNPILESPTVVVSLFVLEDHGIVTQDISPMSDEYVKLIGLKVPHYFLLRNPNSFYSPVEKKIIKDFAGLEKSDKKTKDAIVNFSMYLSIGNMDEAFKAIKAIKSEKVWENMARMCVKTKRLDVAAICLGNMGHAAGARAVRQAVKSKESPEVQAAILAVHLGMIEEAEHILVGCQRYDILNKLYQDSGQWNKALDICENNDRIHLRNTYYNFAKHLENMGDLSGAIPMFERSETHRFEVPRLLFDDMHMLEEYVMKSSDPAIRRWWAQYMESTGEMETALHFYTLAKDYLSLVRVYCYCDNLDKASEIASQTGDKAACYHLARQYENIDNINEAIHFFTRAQAYSNAIRICKEQGLDDQVWNLALLASPTEQLDAARYFETTDHKQFDKAVILYKKAGFLGKALDLAFSTNQHNALQFISGNLNANTDPVLLNKTADFFLQGGQYDRAVEMYAASKNYKKALELCVDRNISVTEEMAERLSIPKDEGTEEERVAALDKIAESCFLQGNYHLATKKWTQEICLAKGEGGEDRLEELKNNMEPVKEFVEIQAMYENDPTGAVERCKNFMTAGNFEFVRRGDVYGFMIEHFARIKQYKPAYTLIEDMKMRINNVNIVYYVNLQTIRNIEAALGVEILGAGAEDEEDDEDDIADETDRFN
ncbi:intraflagellar transport protein 140 homolog [Eurytemora carolleeae]|uniref:intraflagellar transport protein 140 homolog n=1 Tax=Eurytemora carolleeae TaxID=1294199 RepID=UPI000C77E443|nr:intraflagellar transport protein 140 homolog [Eurytemora carolleeae]|eukprot:XP_023331155.1 intraflagellar transport protein 140 homolog [Eurytemora affinis]